MKKINWIIISLLCLFNCISANQTVYLVHGYGSAPTFMSTINNYLCGHGLHTVNFGYHSILDEINVSGKILYESVTESKTDTALFVTHSMGALVFRSMLTYAQKDSSFPVIYRVVMITPPNHGAELADFFTSNRMFSFILGPNIQHLSTDTASLANHLPIPKNMEIGIIVGIKKDSRIGYNPFIKGNNDGYLTPQRTRLGTEKETVLVPSEHSMIIHNKKVLRLTCEFLKNGRFEGD